jgi:hypothetical protein
MNLIKEIIEIADNLDSKGLFKESDEIIKIAQHIPNSLRVGAGGYNSNVLNDWMDKNLAGKFDPSTLSLIKKQIGLQQNVAPSNKRQYINNNGDYWGMNTYEPTQKEVNQVLQSITNPKWNPQVPKSGTGMDPVYLKPDYTLKPGYINYNPPDAWRSGKMIEGNDGKNYVLRARSDIKPKAFTPYDVKNPTSFGRAISAPTPMLTLLVPPSSQGLTGYNVNTGQTLQPYFSDDDLMRYNKITGAPSVSDSLKQTGDSLAKYNKEYDTFWAQPENQKLKKQFNRVDHRV